jgi:phosphomannomutase
MLIGTHSGLRGRPGIELTDAVVERAVGGVVALLAERNLPLTVAIARDERASGETLAKLVVETAARIGADVVDLGIVSTPAAKLFARRHGLGGAIVVTGSHLGESWSGLKPVVAPLYCPADVRLLPPPATQRRQGEIHSDGRAAREHAEAIAAAIDSEAIRNARLTAAWTGGAGPAPQLLFQLLGCCRAENPDVVFGLDPDGDRLHLADERGNALDTELTLPLVATALEPPTVVKGADTSSSVDAVVGRWNGSVHVVEPGELHLVEGIVSTAASLAGEGNGGVILPEIGLARDGLAAAAAILGLLAQSQEPLSELAAAIPRFVVRRSAVFCADDDEAETSLQALADRLGVAPAPSRVGVKAIRDDGSWGLVRQSATEPVLRITVEAASEAEADAFHDELTGVLAER